MRCKFRLGPPHVPRGGRFCYKLIDKLVNFGDTGVFVLAYNCGTVSNASGCPHCSDSLTAGAAVAVNTYDITVASTPTRKINQSVKSETNTWRCAAHACSMK